MKIVLIGQAAFGAKVFETLMEKGENVAAVYTPAEKPGSRPDPLKEAAVSKSIPVFQPATYKDDKVFSEYKDLKPALTIMAFVTDIIPARFLDAATRGAICYHPSILPRHRGASAINWAVMMGDTKTGLTIFWPDGGIDTGPILLQKEIEIGTDDTTGSLYFNHLFPMGVDAILESVALIREGRAPRIPQEKAKATYEPPCDDRVAKIDWNKPAWDLHNFVRGCDPQPGAFTWFRKERVRFLGSKLLKETSAVPPGTIFRIDDQGISVAAVQGSLVVGKIKPEKGGKVSGSEFAAGQGMKEGDRFETVK